MTRAGASPALVAERWLAFGAIVSLVALASALVSQHRYGMEPCPWCVLQRLIVLAIFVACGMGLAWRSARGRAIAATLALVLAASGIAAALWQHFYAAASASCNLTLADKILNATTLPRLAPDVFEPRASCADAAVSLFGIPYDFWSLAVFVVIGMISISLLAGGRRR